MCSRSHSVHVVIKSSQRPFCLDKCLTSVENFVQGRSVEVTVIDDRTRSEHLAMIGGRFPRTTFRSVYDSDTTTVGKEQEQHLEHLFQAWRQTIQGLETDYVLLLEDDQWLSGPIDLTEIAEVMCAHKVQLVDASDHGNLHLRPDHYESIPPLEVGRPRFLDSAERSKLFRWCLFAEFSPSSIDRMVWSGLRHARLHPRLQWLFNYQIFVVAGCVLRTNYLRDIWSADASFGEGSQMSRAIRACLEHPEWRFGYLPEGRIRTSFATSAGLRKTNAFDPRDLNAALTSVWERSERPIRFSTDDSSPEDVLQAVAASGTVLDKASYKEWRQEFENTYARLGFRTRWPRDVSYFEFDSGSS